MCIWIVGSDFESGSTVDIRSVNGWSIIGKYKGHERSVTKVNGKSVITLRLKSQYERNLFGQAGLRVWVTNPISGTWSNARI
jgi:hypothetical protein